MTPQIDSNDGFQNPTRRHPISRRDFLAGGVSLPAMVALGALASRAAADEPSTQPSTQPASPAGGPLSVEFAEECQIQRRYIAFAEKAQADGFPNVAKLFRAVAAAEVVHANMVLAAMKNVRSTTENLQLSADFEDWLGRFVLPASLKAAEKDHDLPRTLLFHKVLGAGEDHSKVFHDALKAVSKRADIADAPIHVCPGCGNVMVGGTPDTCPICANERSTFMMVQ